MWRKIAQKSTWFLYQQRTFRFKKGPNFDKKGKFWQNFGLFFGNEFKGRVF